MADIPSQRAPEPDEPAPTVCGLDESSIVELPDGARVPLGELLDVAEGE